MMAPQFGRYLQYLVIALIGSMIVVSGCRFPLGEKPQGPLSAVPTVELISYTDAVSAYNAKEYEKSAQRFESLRQQTTSALMARKALYGLACSRLMAAESPEAYREAIALWERWIKAAPQRQDSENAALLAPVIREKMIFSYLPAAPDKSDAERPMPAWFLALINQEVQRLQKQLDEAGKGIDTRDKKIKTLEKEISRLNEQINAFETIDQKIQKRKHAIPSAD
jgi:flagellar motility protein MotE (MotC chaperone)